MLSALKASIFHAFFQHWKWDTFSLILPYFSCFFSPTVKTLQNPNLCRKRWFFKEHLKFMGSHLAIYEWKVGFSLISPIFFYFGWSPIGLFVIIYSVGTIQTFGSLVSQDLFRAQISILGYEPRLHHYLSKGCDCGVKKMKEVVCLL